MNIKKLPNAEIRSWYKRELAKIPKLDQQLKKEGKSLVERSRAAWRFRHDKRLEARKMMRDGDEVELLRNRDIEKHGDPDGPSFESLVKKYQKQGMSENEAFNEIIKKAGMTDIETNKKFDV